MPGSRGRQVISLISSANNSQCGGGEVCKCMADFASGGSCTTTGAKGWFQMIDDEPLDLPCNISEPTNNLSSMGHV